MKHLLLLLTLLSTSLSAQDQLRLKVVIAEETATERVYNFILDDFIGVIGWQFQMDFDGAKMSFKEIRNSIQQGQHSGNFNESAPGELRTSWIDPDLSANNYTEPTVVFQMVFDLLDPDGSTLCFKESNEAYEFILEEDNGLVVINEILISDDCRQDFSILFNSTGTEEDQAEITPLITQPNLTSNGVLSFTISSEFPMSMSLINMGGGVVHDFGKLALTPGRHTLQAGGVIPGLYLLHVSTAGEINQSIKVIAY